MTDKQLVTYKDREMLKEWRGEYDVLELVADGYPRRRELLDALIEQAEADKPPLEPGWYEFESIMHGYRHCFVSTNGRVYDAEGCICENCEWGPVGDYAHRLTPIDCSP